MGSITNGQMIYDPSDAASDTVGAYMLAADGTEITHTGAALDVNIKSGADFDIRDLDSAQDNIEIQTAAGQALDIDGSGFLTVNQGTSPWVVSAVNLDTRDLVFATDKVDVSGSSVTVSATNLDIRDLNSSQDNIEIQTAAGQALDIEADGSINANTKQAGYSACAYAAKVVAATATQLIASALTNRKSVLIQNLGGKEAYIGCDASVTVANGIRLPKGASVELNFDASVDLHAISSSLTTDFRILEAA